MAIYTSLSVVLYISLLTCFSCKPINEEPCVFKTQGGFIDLSPLASDNETARFTALDYQTNYEYMWSPCDPINEDAVCENASVCQYIVDIDFYVLMARQDAVLQYDVREGYTALYYTGTDPRDGDTRYTYIELVCSPGVEGQFEFDREEPLRTYHLTLRSKYACMSSFQTTSTRAVSKTTTSTRAVSTTTTSTRADSTTTTSTRADSTTTTSTRIVSITSTTTVSPTKTPSPYKPTEAPGPSPTPFNLMTITILLFCILLALCVLNCMICLGLLTRPSTSGTPASSPGHVNHAFEKKPLN